MAERVPDRRRVVEVIADLGEGHGPRWRYGSGLLVGQRQVLTSAHVVYAAKGVRVRTIDKSALVALVETALVGEPDPRGLDLAVLDVPDADPLPYVSIALVDRDSSIGTVVEGCGAVGYPSFQEVARDPDGHSIRETAQVFGRIAPLSGLVERLLTFEVTSSPQHDLPHAGARLDQTEWSGMSGAGVLAPDAQDREYLVGVVAEHAPRRGASSITVLPLDRLLQADMSRWNPNAWWQRLGVSDPATLPILPTARSLRRPRLAFEPETVEIPAGRFLMGSDDGAEFERPQQTMTLASYSIGVYPVTNAQYEEFVRDTHRRVAPEVDWRIARRGQEPPAEKRDHPVVGVTWDEAVAYCHWLAERTGRPYRLPTEAEWEKSARGIDGRRFPWGDAFDVDRCNSAEAAHGHTTPVGVYSPRGNSTYGCADLAGNVVEWTSTLWGSERGCPDFSPPYQADDGREDPRPSRPFRELRVCRGGSFRDPAERSTCFARGRQPADARAANRGFRVALGSDQPLATSRASVMCC